MPRARPAGDRPGECGRVAYGLMASGELDNTSRKDHIVLRFLLNIIWLVTGGIWLALSYFLFGLLACIFIITIPIGIASFRMASFALWPFGRTVIKDPRSGNVSAIANVIWFIVAGLGIAATHVTTALAQAITIIGIPLAIANLKMLPVTCFPFGKKIVDSRAVPPSSQPLLSI